MKAFIDYILQFGDLNQQQIDLITKKAEILDLPKEEYFSEAGKIAQQVGFVLEGVIRVCYYNNKGEEITKYFIDENNLVVDLESFNNDICSNAYVQAVTDCKLLVFSKKEWKELLDIIIPWNAIVNKVISRALIQKVERRSPLVSEDATTRYLMFLKIYPNVVNRVPLSYIASYLGITQSSLSRIRKNIR
jgi:CRP-like cAMP-binding protein